MSDEQKTFQTLKRMNWSSLLILIVGFLFLALLFILDVRAPNPWFSILSILAFACMAIGIGISAILGILAIKATRKYKSNQFKIYYYQIFAIIIGLIVHLIRSFFK
ncbi:hypothetical protein IU403_03925 [Aerococcaceae bacterium zg-BR22]|uniref:hypothetical protein n=1 Tax=Aerococcaceae bacterium zg-1292 TaxID=2774330 RepID=UPI004062BB4B|nr:hypothetical protein [Aerococcaceae bacterium zg-BR22]